MFEHEFQPPNGGLDRNSRLPQQGNGYDTCIAHLRAQGGLLALTVIINILLLYLFQTVGAWLLLGLLRMTGFSLFSMEAVNELYTMLLYVVAFFLPYLLYAKAVRYDLRLIPRETPYPPVLLASTGISLGISVGGMILSLVVSTLFALFGLYPMEFPIGLPSDLFAAVLFIINTTVIPALIEEFVNRGIVLGSLRRYGDRFAIVISALIFALLHRNMAQIPNAFLLGLALGYFVIKTNSIWTGIFIHFTNNMLILLFSVFTSSMSDLQMLYAEGALFLFYLLVCGVGLFYFNVIRKADMSLMPSDCPVREGLLYRSWLTHFPTVMMLLLFVWVIYLNFSRF